MCKPLTLSCRYQANLRQRNGIKIESVWGFLFVPNFWSLDFIVFDMVLMSEPKQQNKINQI